MLAEVQEELQEARKETTDFDAKMAEQKKLHALHKKQLASCEKRLGKKNAEIEKRVSSAGLNSVLASTLLCSCVLSVMQ